MPHLRYTKETKNQRTENMASLLKAFILLKGIQKLATEYDIHMTYKGNNEADKYLTAGTSFSGQIYSPS